MIVGDWPDADAHTVVGGPVAVPDGGEAVGHCQICCTERRHVERVELPLWPDTEVVACPTCRAVYSESDSNRCARCGKASPDCYVEVEGEIGDVALPALLATKLCAECGGDLIAFQLTEQDVVPDAAMIEAEPDPEQREALREELEANEP